MPRFIVKSILLALVVELLWSMTTALKQRREGLEHGRHLGYVLADAAHGLHADRAWFTTLTRELHHLM